MAIVDGGRPPDGIPRKIWMALDVPPNEKDPEELKTAVRDAVRGVLEERYPGSPPGSFNSGIRTGTTESKRLRIFVEQT